MATPDIAARLKHLDGAAHILAETAPQISRHLNLRHNALAFQHEVDPPAERRRTVCGACGTLVKPGVNGKLERERKGKRSSKAQSSVQHQTTLAVRTQARIYTCFTCNRTTRMISKYPANKPRRKEKAGVPTAAALIPPIMDKPAPVPVPQTAGAKKSRSSKKSGLAALLAQQKKTQSSSSGFGLNLMDFMKRS
jgi:RNase P subunit RPR2